MKPLDNLCHPVSVIREAEELAAQAFGAAPCLFDGGRHHLRGAGHDPLCGQAGGEDHPAREMSTRSVMGAMVLCGAVPVYVDPACDDRLGIPLACAGRMWRPPLRSIPTQKRCW